MVENVEKRRGRRGRWLVLAALLAIGMWVVRSRRAAQADVGTGWPTSRPAGAGAEWRRPGEGSTPVPAERPVPAPDVGPSSPAPATSAGQVPAAAQAARRPSPRPRAAAPTQPASEPAGGGLPPGQR
jgi:putative peptide zinc metalloprotease protein